MENLDQSENVHYLDSVLSQAKLLFREAALSFDGGANAGASLLCRSTLEAACYLFLTRVEVEEDQSLLAKELPDSVATDSAFSVRIPRDLTGLPRRVSWDELQRAISGRKVLSKEQLASLGRIRRRGNVVAHLASRRDATRYKLRSDRKASLWIKKEDALQDLRDTADILKRLAHLLAFFPEYTFSGPPRKTITATEAYLTRKTESRARNDEGTKGDSSIS